MKKLPLLLLIVPLLLQANRVKPKVMHAQDRREYHHNYSHSSNHHDRTEDILCSTTEASGEIMFMITVQATSEVTSEGHHGHARLSYLDSNRVEITEDIAKGEGEHLETLLSIIKPDYDKKSLIVIQEHFDELIYLNHNDFLEKVAGLIS